MSADATGFAWRYSPVTKGGLLVHLALADVANDMHSNELWCSVDTIARKTRLNRSTVMNALGDMVAGGVLELLEERPGRTNRYRMLYPQLPVVFSDTPLQKGDTGVVESDTDLSGNPTRTQEVTQANQRDRVGKCDGWAEISPRTTLAAALVGACVLEAGHDGECSAYVEPLVERRADLV